MCPTDGTGSAAVGSTTGDGLAGAADACTTVGALFETAFWEFPEQPKKVNRTPVDTNKKTFFIVVSSQKCSSNGRRLNVLKSEVLSPNFE
jgi:hypothetical protein